MRSVVDWTHLDYITVSHDWTSHLIYDINFNSTIRVAVDDHQGPRGVLGAQLGQGEDPQIVRQGQAPQKSSLFHSGGGIAKFLSGSGLIRIDVQNGTSILITLVVTH